MSNFFLKSFSVLSVMIVLMQSFSFTSKAELATHYDIATGITTTDCIALILNTFDGSYRIGEITCDENDCVDCSSLVGRDVKTALEMLRNSDS